jgi:hypothetical protein
MLSSYQKLLLGHIREIWHRCNEEHLGNALTPPVFTLLPTKHTLGHWKRNAREIGISESLLNHSMLELEHVLKHEMAHQYADEVLEASTQHQETAHGSGFRYACTKLGIGHYAKFHPKGEPPPILRRITKLLQLAESQNVHEAEAALAKARTLMEKYELEIGLDNTEFCYEYLGKPIAQKNMLYRAIGGTLSQFFNVELMWIPTQQISTGKNLWQLEAMGTAANVEIAQYIFWYLHNELEYLWLQLRRKDPNIKGRSLKRDFQYGVIRGLNEKLAQERAAEAEHYASSSKELLIIKRERLEGFSVERHPHRRASRRGTYRKSDAYYSGVEEGRKLELNKGIKPQKQKLLGS